jgi:hypothetical protein
MSPSKYQPLADWLAAYTGDSVTLTLAQVEAILGQPLPVLARIERAWWASTRNRYVLTWRTLGWEATLDRRLRTVRFVRNPDSTGQ